jgi:hypothetical protein
MALAQGGATVPSQTIPMNVEVKMFDRDVTKGAVNLTYPLYTGGKMEAITAMAHKGSQIAREQQRKTALEVVRDVSKYYHGAVFAQQMAALSSDTLERFQVLEELTDRLYQNTSLKVKKTDYLRSKTTTALIRSATQEAQYASGLTKDALANGLNANLVRRWVVESSQRGDSYYFAFKDIDVIQLNPVRLCIRSGSDSSDRKPLLSALSAASRLAKTVLPMQSSRSASQMCSAGLISGL